jgi:hypothetical protein
MDVETELHLRLQGRIQLEQQFLEVRKEHLVEMQEGHLVSRFRSDRPPCWLIPYEQVAQTIRDVSPR